MGRRFPPASLGLRTGFTFFRNLFNLAALFDYRGGHWVENSTDSFRCNGGIIYCRGLVDPTAPLEMQANAAAATYGDANGVTEWGFFEPGWFIKLRELSLTFNAPDHIARTTRGQPRQPDAQRHGISGPSTITAGSTPR